MRAQRAGGRAFGRRHRRSRGASAARRAAGDGIPCRASPDVAGRSVSLRHNALRAAAMLTARLPTGPPLHHVRPRIRCEWDRQLGWRYSVSSGPRLPGGVSFRRKALRERGDPPTYASRSHHGRRGSRCRRCVQQGWFPPRPESASQRPHADPLGHVDPTTRWRDRSGKSGVRARAGQNRRTGRSPSAASVARPCPPRTPGRADRRPPPPAGRRSSTEAGRTGR